MIPGTWLKHYVCPGPNALPMYFHFIGQLRDADSERFIIETEWGQRLEVNDWFLQWLEPIDAEESPKVRKPRATEPPLANKPMTGGKRAPLPALAAAATPPAQRTDEIASRTYWPRLTGR